MNRLLVLGLVLSCGFVDFATAMPMSAGSGTALSGTVAETMDGGRYTYMKVDTASGPQWIAATQMKVSVGDAVTVNGGTTMKNFTSPTLDRTFDSIIFAESVQVGSGGATSSSPKLPAGHPPVSGHGGMGGDSDSTPRITGVIAETMDTGNYTYIKVTSGGRDIWVATSQIEAKVGEQVTVPPGMLVMNFESPTLNRTFDEIYFVDTVHVGATTDEDSEESEDDDTAVAPVGTPATVTTTKPEGALTVAEIFTRRTELAGKKVTVHGKVTKFTEKVMGKNWVHVSDGTADGENRDVTLTTLDSTRVGEVITATGTVAIDEDFGYTYQYPVLIKDSTLSATP